MFLEKDGIPYIYSGAFARCGDVVHGFLGKEVGVSPPKFFPHKPVRGARLAAEVHKDLSQSYNRLARAFGLSQRGPVTANQVHGNSVLIVEDKGAGGHRPVEADAMVTNVAGVALGVLTADCLPILLFDPVKRVAGAVHSGWRGTVKKVATGAVEAFKKRFGSSPGDIFAALGPCIGPCCYVVDDEVTGEFKRAFGEGAGYLTEGPARRLDLRAANIEQLLSAGLGEANISTETVCTSCRSELFFSYRKEGLKAGRQLSFVMMGEGPEGGFTPAA